MLKKHCFMLKVRVLTSMHIYANNKRIYERI
jgi:hypothetical protein